MFAYIMEFHFQLKHKRKKLLKLKHILSVSSDLMFWQVWTSTSFGKKKSYKLFVVMKLTERWFNIFVYLFVVLNAGDFMEQKFLGSVKT